MIMKQFKFVSLLLLATIFAIFFSCDNNDEPVDEPFVLPSKVINKIIVDEQGVKWFATEKGVVSYNDVSWTTYSDDKGLSNGPIADLASHVEAGITKLWMASIKGASSLEFGATSISFMNYNTANSGILSDNVSAVGVDANNVKYLGTSIGLSIFKGTTWDKYFGRKGEGEILAKYKISAISTSKNGYVYAATEGGGISRFKYTDAISGATTFSKPWANGLPSDTIYAMILANDTCQWYGTNKGVAFHASEFTKEDWTTYTRNDGLICDTVYAIAKDLSGNIWFGTHKGVSKLVISKDTTWTSYTTKDGLISNKVNAVAADLDGSIWFGTDEGISHLSNNKWEKF
jgi:ligand-binding sensor domain-containing protein